MTTTALARSSEWSDVTLYDGWGDCDGADMDKTYKMLGDMVVDEFQRLAYEAGIDGHWYTYTSEFIGEINQDDELIEKLDELREEAKETIWKKWTDGDIEPIK